MNLLQLRDKYVGEQGFKTEQMRDAIRRAWMAGAVTAMTTPQPPPKKRASSLRERVKGAIAAQGEQG